MVSFTDFLFFFRIKTVLWRTFKVVTLNVREITISLSKKRTRRLKFWSLAWSRLLWNWRS
jgi:hypothetical protein